MWLLSRWRNQNTLIMSLSVCLLAVLAFVGCAQGFGSERFFLYHRTEPWRIGFCQMKPTGITDSPFFTITTEQDEPVDVDFFAHHKPRHTLASKVFISQSPKHGAFPRTSPDNLDLERELCDSHTVYIPEPDYFGEDEFVYSLLHENLTKTADGKFMVRVVIRGKAADPIVAVSDEATMSITDGHVHIPVLKNDYIKDEWKVCLTKNTAPRSSAAEVTFEDVAPKLGIDSLLQIPPKAPDCLFDNYDPNLKVWVKGSFCILELSAGASATGDYDDDGLLDIYYTRMDGPDELWRSLGDGTFRLVTAEANLSSTAYHHSAGIVFVDIDNDGDQDLYVATLADTRFYLYVNDGLGHFTEEAEERGLVMRPTIPPFQTSTMTIAVGDYDKDGWLDLYTTEWMPHLDQSFDYNNATHSLSRLMRNMGVQGKPGHFEDVTVAAGLGKTHEPTVDADKFGGVDVRYYGVVNTGLLKDIIPGSFKLSAMFTDLDNDGHLDIVMSGDFQTSTIYWNNGNGTFTEGTKAAGVGTDQNGMGCTVADVDFDGKQDWFVTSIHMTKEQIEPFKEVYLGGGFIFGFTGNRFYHNEGGRKFSDQTDEAGVRFGNWAWGAAFFDFDNDGDLDLIHTNGFDDPDVTDTDFLHDTPTKLFENRYFDDGENKVKFVSVGKKRGVMDTKDGRGLFVFDYDNDGDLDVFIVNSADSPILYKNDGGNKNDFLRIQVLEAEVERESLGARVYLYSPRLKKEIMREVRTIGAHSAHGERIVHFGLGAETAETFEVRIFWPNTNNTRIIKNVPRRHLLKARDIKGQRNSVVVTSSQDSVPDCTKLLVKEVSRAPANGQVIVSSKHVTYYAKAEFEGEDSFDYVISDGVNSAKATVNVKVTKPAEQEQSSEKPQEMFSCLDGSNNNLAHPEWGKPMSPLLRLLPPDYADNFDAPAGPNRPSPRLISNVLFDQRQPVPSQEGLNDFHVHFGQLVAHDTDFATPYANFLTTDNLGIPVPEGDPWFDPHSNGNEIMRFRRSAQLQTTGKLHGVPREQVNKVTSYLDLSVIYGSDSGRANVLRSMKDGKLLHQSNDIIDFNSKHVANLNLLSCPRDKLLVSGDNRVNVQPGMIVHHTLWSREHNLICDELKKHPGNEEMDDETLFQHARALTRAKFQKVVWREFLPTVIGIQEFEKLGSYRGYNSSIRVGIFNEFATAAFRFGHSQVGDTLLRLNKNWTMCDTGHLSLRDAYFNPGRILREGGIEPLIRGMLIQKAQNVDARFTDAVRNFLFGTNTMGLDLASIGIQRGRDHGLPDYNAVREGVGLPRRKSFDEITPDENVQKKLGELYTSVDDVDLWVGALAESHVQGGCVGETFARIIAMQYRILRDGDRFWFENSETALYNLKDRNTLPTRGITMNEIILRNTGIRWGNRTSPFHSRDM